MEKDEILKILRETALTGTKVRIEDIYGLEHVGAIDLAMSDADSGCGEPCIGVDCDEILLKLSEIKAISIA